MSSVCTAHRKEGLFMRCQTFKKWKYVCIQELFVFLINIYGVRLSYLKIKKTFRCFVIWFPIVSPAKASECILFFTVGESKDSNAKIIVQELMHLHPECC